MDLPKHKWTDKMKFQFSTAPKIIFGSDTAKSIPDHAFAYGQ